jgi:mono/diheme cytochrome c family protein
MATAARELLTVRNVLVAAAVLCVLGYAMRVHAVDAAERSGADVAQRIALRTSRSSPLDLEVGGELAGVEKGGTRYISRGDLLSLPQVKFTVSNDANFTEPVEVRGVTLEELTKHLGESPHSDLVVAICDDLYRANYSRAYIAAHHPVLVLEINGKPPDGWPKDPEGSGLGMGPYMITHAQFTPQYKILSHEDQAQIPWGVVRLEFRNEDKVFGAIAPRGSNANSPDVQAGYKIAQQNCFRCHNMDGEGGQKAGHPWLVLSAWATADPDYFRAYVHNPRLKNPRAQMPAFPEYDAATLDALRAYFSTFTSLPVAASHLAGRNRAKIAAHPDGQPPAAKP